MQDTWKFAALLLLLGGCAGPRSAVSGPTPLPETSDDALRAGYAELARDLREAWLNRDTVPGPVVSYTPQTRSEGGLVLTVAPALPEDEPWNAWPDGTARLFNDGVGYLWRVQIASDKPVRWSPPHTQLAVNDTEQTFLPVAEPDDLLMPLRRGAALETTAGVAPDLSLRMRNADPFRRAYLGTNTATGARDGVVVFPAPTRNLQAVAMELTLGVWVEGEGIRQYRFLFE